MHSIIRGIGAVVCAASAGLAQPVFDATEYTARSIARTAILDLRLTTTPGDADYRVASQLLSLAHDLTPKDTDILRRWIQAAYACADGPLVLELNRKLVDLDPRDTVAQLRQITASITQRNQTAEERLAVYEQFLDPKGRGRQLDPSVLSRLALDAALLLRERGDDEGFIRKLVLATQLDSSHKEAAQLAAAVLSERQPDNRLGRVQMLENLLMADPVDPNVHLSIAHELAAAGAFTGARRFLGNAGTIGSVIGMSADTFTLQAFVLDWRDKGPRHVVEALNKELANARAKAERDAAAMREKGAPEAEIPKASDVRLSPQMRMLYILALDAMGEADALKQAMTELTNDVAVQLGKLTEEISKSPERTEQYARVGIEVATQIVMMRLWTNTEVAGAETDLASGNAIERAQPETAEVLRAWVRLRQGHLDEAVETLRPLADAYPFAALGVALCDELSGRKEDAIAGYTSVVHRHPTDSFGAYASTRRAALGFTPDAKLIAALDAVAGDIPQSIDRMAVRPDLAQRIEVKVGSVRAEAIERQTMTITVQNMSDFPLAVGSDRPISSRFLLSPKFESTSEFAAELVQPEVVDVDRRLRLKPREKMEFQVWPDAGQTGWLMEGLANRTIRVRWRITQGFQVDDRGGFRPGIMSLTTETEAQRRIPIPEASIPGPDMAARIATEPGAVIARLAAATRAAILQPILVPAEKGGAAALPPSVAEAFATRYPKLSARDRAMLVAVLPHAGLSPMMAPVDQAMRAETETLPLCIVLVTRVAKPDDELLVKCTTSDDPRVRALAVALAEKLSGQVRTYSRLSTTALKPPAEPGAAPAPEK